MSKCYEFATVYSDFGRTLHLECYVYTYNLNNLKSNKWTKNKQKLKPEIYNLFAHNAAKNICKIKYNKIICK